MASEKAEEKHEAHPHEIITSTGERYGLFDPMDFAKGGKYAKKAEHNKAGVTEPPQRHAEVAS